MIPIQHLQVGDLVCTLKINDEKILKPILNIIKYPPNQIFQISILKTDDIDNWCGYDEPVFLEFMAKEQSIMGRNAERLINVTENQMLLEVENIHGTKNLYLTLISDI